MESSSKTKNIVILVIIFAISFFAYTFFFKSSGPTEILTKETPLLGQENVKGKNLLRILLSLNSIKLDEEIFSSQLFTGLQDFTIVLPEVDTPGRPNPFAPIGTEESSPLSASPSENI